MSPTSALPLFPKLVPFMPDTALESYINNKTISVKSFFSDHLLKQQFQTLDIIKCLAFIISEFESRDVQEQRDDDMVPLKELLLNSLQLITDNQIGLVQTGRKMLLSHMGQSAIAKDQATYSILRDQDLAQIRANHSFRQALASAIPRGGPLKYFGYFEIGLGLPS